MRVASRSSARKAGEDRTCTCPLAPAALRPIARIDSNAQIHCPGWPSRSIPETGCGYPAGRMGERLAVYAAVSHTVASHDRVQSSAERILTGSSITSLTCHNTCFFREIPGTLIMNLSVHQHPEYLAC